MNTPAKQSLNKPADYSDIFGSVPFPLKQHVSRHGRLTAVSMMKDEGPFVLEWVAHHLALGFTDLVVYTNACSDGTDDILIRLEELGLVHHRRNVIREGIRPQPSAIKHAQAEPVVQNSDWVLVFDADEFLCIKYGDGTLDPLLDAVKAEDANGLVITWRIYGSNNIQHWSRAPVTEQYLSAAPPGWNKGWGVKTLFQFDPDKWKLGIHRPKIKNKHLKTDFPHQIKWLNGSGLPMEDYFKFRGWRSIARTVGYDWVQMNHYAIKSMDSYALRKLRGNVNNKADKYNAAYWALQDRNEIHDASALAHQVSRAQNFDLLLSDPVLAQLHENALERVEKRLAQFRQTQDYRTLIAELQAASHVPINEVNAKPPKPRDPRKIAQKMSDIEKIMTADAPNDDMPTAEPDPYPYLPAPLNVSEPLPVTFFANHEIDVPADPRVLTDAALQAVTEGKFLRNHARRLPRLLVPADRYLEIGAGIGFLAAVVARSGVPAAVFAQEDSAGLHSVARVLWDKNGLSGSTDVAVLDTVWGASGAEGRPQATLADLMTTINCSVLHINDPHVDPRGVDDVLRAAPQLRLLIFGPRALCGACGTPDLSAGLQKLGFQVVQDAPLTQSLVLERAPN